MSRPVVLSMRICYILLSPTLGLYQYTADLANRVARAGRQVSLVTSRQPIAACPSLGKRIIEKETHNG